MDEIDEQDIALLETNDISGRWFDLSQSLILPDGENVWLARRLDQRLSRQLTPYLAG